MIRSTYIARRASSESWAAGACIRSKRGGGFFFSLGCFYSNRAPISRNGDFRFYTRNHIFGTRAQLDFTRGLEKKNIVNRSTRGELFTRTEETAADRASAAKLCVGTRVHVYRLVRLFLSLWHRVKLFTSAVRARELVSSNERKENNREYRETSLESLDFLSAADITPRNYFYKPSTIICLITRYT